MNYCITMERTLSLAINFEAENDDEAYTKAERISQDTKASDFEAGSEERDYALCDSDTCRTLVDWH